MHFYTTRGAPIAIYEVIKKITVEQRIFFVKHFVIIIISEKKSGRFLLKCAS